MLFRSTYIHLPREWGLARPAGFDLAWVSAVSGQSFQFPSASSVIPVTSFTRPAGLGVCVWWIFNSVENRPGPWKPLKEEHPSTPWDSLAPDLILLRLQGPVAHKGKKVGEAGGWPTKARQTSKDGWRGEQETPTTNRQQAFAVCIRYFFHIGILWEEPTWGL